MTAQQPRISLPRQSRQWARRVGPLMVMFVALAALAIGCGITPESLTVLHETNTQNVETCGAPVNVEHHDHDGHDHGGLGTLTTPLTCGSSTKENPCNPAHTSAVEGYASYAPQKTCSASAKAGVTAFKDLLLKTYPCTSSLGIVRGCSIGGTSEHKEGRAFDWGVNAFTQAAVAKAALDWLLATRNGVPHALVRRFGIMYMVWNRKIWSAYRANEGWRNYTGSNPHTDHVHFSFSWAGANKQTSFWGGQCTNKNPLCPATGIKKFCNKHEIVTCNNGQLSIGNCAAYGSTCTTQGPGGVRCRFVACPDSGKKDVCFQNDVAHCTDGNVKFTKCPASSPCKGTTAPKCTAPAPQGPCPATGIKKFCDKDEIITCVDGQMSRGNCAVYGSTCTTQGPGGVRCRFVACPDSGKKDVCFMGDVAHCTDGNVKFTKCPASTPCTNGACTAPKPPPPPRDPPEPKEEPAPDAGTTTDSPTPRDPPTPPTAPDDATPDDAGPTDSTNDTTPPDDRIVLPPTTQPPANPGEDKVKELPAPNTPPTDMRPQGLGCQISTQSPANAPFGGLALLFLVLLTARRKRS